jgi:molybdopterin synthase catalytic subunit
MGRQSPSAFMHGRFSMDLSAALTELKQEPGFADQVGMVLIHNGVVRGHSRESKDSVASLQVTPDQNRIEALRREYESRPGIFRILVQANQGDFQPGHDLLFIIVAGDIRENVHPVLAELLDRIKSEAMHKVEA